MSKLPLSRTKWTYLLERGHTMTQKNDSTHDQDTTLTNRQGHPITNNQNLRTVSNRGPATLENYDFLEKISHFDRERVPERVVHARGAGAHGYFETYGVVGNEPISKYTRQRSFRIKEKKHLYLSVFQRLYMVDTLLKHYEIHEALL